MVSPAFAVLHSSLPMVCQLAILARGSKLRVDRAPRNSAKKDAMEKGEAQLGMKG